MLGEEGLGFGGEGGRRGGGAGSCILKGKDGHFLFRVFLGETLIVKGNGLPFFRGNTVF